MARPTLDQYYLAMLALVASRSTCPRRAVGAIVVDDKGVILGVGYNGTPRGVVHCKGDASIFHPQVKETVATSPEWARSNRVSLCEAGADPKGDTSRCWAEHAERNALAQCGGDQDRAHTIYVSATPCFSCAKGIVNAGIKRVVAAQYYSEQLQGFATGEQVLLAAGITLEVAQVPAP